MRPSCTRFTQKANAAVFRRGRSDRVSSCEFFAIRQVCFTVGQRRRPHQPRRVCLKYHRLSPATHSESQARRAVSLPWPPWRCGALVAWLGAGPDVAIGIVPNMFADVTQSSTPLASSFPRFFSRAGELRFLQQVSNGLLHDLAINNGYGCCQWNVLGADLHTVPGVTALVDSTIAHHRC